MIKDNEIPAFLAQFFTTAPKGSFSLKQRHLAKSISQFVESDLFGLYLLEKESYPLATLISQPKQEMVKEYEYYRNQDPLFQYLLQQGGAVEGIELLGEEQWLRNPIGQMLQRWQMQYTIQGAISIQGKIIGTLNFARAADAGRFHAVDTLKVAALCREVSRLLETGKSPSLTDHPVYWTEHTFVTSPTFESTDATLVTDIHGRINQSKDTTIQNVGVSPQDLQAIIRENILSLQSDSHQLIERTVFTESKKCLTLATLPLPGDQSSFITIIKTKPAALLNGKIPSQSSGDTSELGARTQQALDLLIRGYSNKLIAREMGVSENTIKDHIRRIFQHYGVSNRTELSWRLAKF